LQSCRRLLSPLADRPVVLVEGFLAFYDNEVNAHYDFRIFLRERRAVLKRRREERATYVRRRLRDRTELVQVIAGSGECRLAR